MLKSISFFLALSLLLALTSCGGSSKPAAHSEATQQNPRFTSGEAPADPDTSADTLLASDETGADEQTIYDQNNIKVTYLGYDPNGNWGPEIQLYVENNSEKEYLVQVRNFLVNGIPVAPQLSIRFYSGESGPAPLIILRTGLSSNNISAVESVEFSFYFMESSTVVNVIESDIITLNID